jgi:hypothetical protein
MTFRRTCANHIIQSLTPGVPRRRIARGSASGSPVQGMNRRIGAHDSNIFYQSRDGGFSGLAAQGLAPDSADTVRGLGLSDMACMTRAGFKVVFLQIEADHNKVITMVHALIEVYFRPPSYIIGTVPFLIGSVNILAKLAGPLSLSSACQWTTNITVSCPYHQGNADQLPNEVKEIGVGAFITGVIQTLFGTSHGLTLLGLEGFRLPECGGESSNVIVMAR